MINIWMRFYCLLLFFFSYQSYSAPVEVSGQPINLMLHAQILYSNLDSPVSIENLLQQQKAPWQPYTDIFHSANHKMKQYYWLKFELHQSQEKELQRILELENSYAEKIYIYKVTDPERPAIENLSQTQHAYLPSGLVLPLNLQPNTVTQLYMYVESYQTMPIQLMLWPPYMGVEHIQQQFNFEGAQIGIVLTMSFFSFLMMIKIRSINHNLFGAYNLALGLFMLATYGYSEHYLLHESQYIHKALLILLPPIILICIVFFSYRILKLTKYHAIKPYTYMLLGSSVTLSLSGFLLSQKWAVLLNIFLIGIVAIMLMAVAVAQWKSHQKFAMNYLIGWGVFIINILISSFILMRYRFEMEFLYNVVFSGMIIQSIYWYALMTENYYIERIEQDKKQRIAIKEKERALAHNRVALKHEEKENEKLEQLIQERTAQLEVSMQDLEITMQELNSVNYKLMQQSVTDMLTGIRNKEAFDEQLQTEGLSSMREKTPLSLLMIDIDYFKTINDTYGHLAGDFVLKEFAKQLRQACQRPKDFVARFGGEEFVMLLPQTHKKGALHKANQLCQTIRESTILWKKQIISVTVSIGVTTHTIETPEDIQQLMHLADQALYKAKDAGRNQAIAIPFSNTKN